MNMIKLHTGGSGSMNNYSRIKAEAMREAAHYNNYVDADRTPLNCIICPYKTPQDLEAHLQENGITVTIRKEFGSDIDAACGQLRAKEEGKL